MALSMIEELTWLQNNPQFEERPASITEFLAPEYLNINSGVRDSIKVALEEIMGSETNGERMSAFPRAIITGGIGIGKQQPIHTPVLTPTGWKPIGLLKPGDSVIGSDGKPTKVTGIFPQGRKANFRVTTTDGASTLAGPDHLWQVHHFKKKNRGQGPEILTTQEILDRGLVNSQGQRLWQVPVVGAVEYAPQSEPLPIPAYTIGALLGDGGLTQGTVRFSTKDDAILLRLHAETGIAPKYITGCDWRFTTERGKPNDLLRAVQDLEITVRSEFKHIPEIYLMASIADRKNLLAGLLDTDGWQSGSLNHTSFTSASKQLADDVVTLVRSLGGIACKPKFKRNEHLGSWSTTIKTDFCPFWIDRKASLWSDRSANPIVRSIDSIEYEADFESVCIKVEASDELYVTEDFLVTHNTTIASIVLPYLAHWTLCLNNPQEFFGLLPGSRIAFMQMSTSGSQAKEVVFGDIKARIQYSPWFSTKYPYNTAFKNQLRFPKDIWILPGDSAETTFEGYNILGGILDEADSHKVTKNKDYAQQGYTTISSRISSRFQDRGFIMVIGQMKRANGFAAKIYEEYSKDPKAYAIRMSIWESMGWEKFTDPNGERRSFWYDPKRFEILPKTVGDLLRKENSSLIEIPSVYEQDFRNNPEKALRDLAGYPPHTNSPFISLTYKVEEARDRWVERQGNDQSPYSMDGSWEPWFRAPDTLKRVCHIDMAYSAEGDALGFAMGHVREMKEVEGENKPYIVIDCLVRIKATTGREIFLGDVRRMIYTLKDDFKFKIVKVSLDGFQSTDTRQQLERRRIGTDIVSVDKTVLPYHDLREAIYEDRIEFPKYVVKLSQDATSFTEILVKELVELVDTGTKVDHPPEGSKDVADAVAGVVYNLMGDRTFHKNKLRTLISTGDSAPAQVDEPRLPHHAIRNSHVPNAPLPPSGPMEWRPPRRR